MVPLRALVFRSLVEGNEDFGNEIASVSKILRQEKQLLLTNNSCWVSLSGFSWPTAGHDQSEKMQSLLSRVF